MATDGASVRGSVTTMTVGPLGQRTMAEGIADVLRRAILSGELRPGHALREMQLAVELGVSRAPLREALRALDDEGLVERQAFKGSVVATVTAREVEEIASVRQQLEPLAVGLGLASLQSGGASELRAAVATLEQVTESGDAAGSIDAHLAVHRLLYERSGNAVLLDIWRSWESRLRLYWVVDHQSFTRLTDVAVGHRRLVQLVLDGDLDALRADLERHVQSHGLAEQEPPEPGQPYT